MSKHLPPMKPAPLCSSLELHEKPLSERIEFARRTNYLRKGDLLGVILGFLVELAQRVEALEAKRSE